MQASAKSRPVYEKLDTAYVNLAALLRYLQRRNFTGRVHVEMNGYEADVSLSAAGGLDARETDHAMGREAQGEAVLQRLIVRAMEAGGLISIYEEPEAVAVEGAEDDDDDATLPEDEEEAVDWGALLRLSAEIIGAVERAALAVGVDFHAAFNAARLEVADDFSFLDPSNARFEYSNSDVRLHAEPSAKVYIAGISACLRRTVERLTTGERAGSVRERVALQLAVLARRRQAEIMRLKLMPLLDRIAGTRVL
ncbi:MAG: hypothetical protein WCF57_22135 [Pyrinomonadaceae bacterium]